jgi:hypothetical protein
MHGRIDTNTGGTRVKWQYRHSLNSKSSVLRIKYGEFLGYGKRDKNIAHVLFDGQKSISRVPVSELQETETKNELA